VPFCLKAVSRVYKGRSWMQLSPLLSKLNFGLLPAVADPEFLRMRVWIRCLIAVAGLLPVSATTLEQLTLDEMIQKSTAIVRARIAGSHAAALSGTTYTYFELEVLESWKGQSIREVAIPGGVINGIRQSVAGAPQLKPGQEYVLFLWTSRSGLTQVMGLSQGRFHVSEVSSGGVVAQRPPASELMVDRSGSPVDDRAVSFRLQDLRARVLQTLRAAK